MPLDAWLLLVASIGLGLGLELAFMRAQLRKRRDGGRADSEARSAAGRWRIDGDRGRDGERDP